MSQGQSPGPGFAGLTPQNVRERTKGMVFSMLGELLKGLLKEIKAEYTKPIVSWKRLRELGRIAEIVESRFIQQSTKRWDWRSAPELSKSRRASQ